VENENESVEESSTLLEAVWISQN